MTTVSAPTAAQVWRVLVIDDSPEDRTEVRRLLLRGSERRYKLAEAETGAAGVRAVLDADELPDCVVLDYNLPDMDAVEVLAALAGPDGLTACPVVVLTGTVGHEQTRTVLRAGAQDYLGKGWMTPESLTRAVENAAERWAMARELQDRDASLRETNQQLKMAMVAANAGSWQINLTTGEFSASERAIELHGLPPGTHLNHERALACVHPDDRASIEAALRQTFESGKPFRHEHRVPQPDGSVRWVSSHAERVGEGSQACVIGLVQDVTERKEAESQLLASEHRLRLTLEAAATGLWDWDVATNVVTWSPECYSIHGLKKEEFDGTAAAFDRLLDPDDRSRVWASVRAAVDGRTRYACEFRIVRPDGEVRWVANTGRAVYDHGQPVKMVGTITDITDRKRAEEQLRVSEELNRSLMDGSADCVKVLDTEGRLRHINAPGLCLMEIDDFGPLCGQAWSVMWPAESHEDVARAVATASGGGNYSFQAFCPTAKGTPRWWEVAVSPVRDTPDGPVVRLLSVSRDITARKATEDFLRQSESRFQVALMSTRILVYTTDHDLRYTWVQNPHPAFTPADLLGRRDDELLPPEQAAPLTAIKLDVLNSGVGRRTEFSVDINGERASYDLTVEPLRDGTGKVVGVTVAAMEISERKKIEDELRRLATELSEADRRKNVFLATLAHELRNPLAPIRNGLQVIRLAGSKGKVEQTRTMIERQVSQLVRLVDDLLDISRITQGKVELRKERVELRAVIDAAVETSRPGIEQAGHELAVVVPDEPIFVDGDATRLAQVVSNLLNNSAKYTHRGGHIRLTAGHEGGAAVVSVKDDGIGIPPAMLGRVFEMFTQVDRTLEKTTGGLGIGLSLVKGLMEMHGGTIEARSDGEGMGSEFVVRLPVVTAAVAGSNHPDEQTSERVPRGLRILVVDDNVDSADLFAQLLEMLGIEVRTANDGEAGIELAAQYRPDVVVMDIGMPKLNGYEAARRIREQPWGVGMVLVALTGWGQEEDRKRSADAGFNHHLVKPVETDALMKLLAGVKTATAESGQKDGSIAHSPTALPPYNRSVEMP